MVVFGLWKVTLVEVNVSVNSNVPKKKTDEVLHVFLDICGENMHGHRLS